MPTVRETVAEMVQFVFPQYAGAPDQIYGGRMMEWIATAGTLAASRLARGPVAIGAMDDLDFLHPVRVGQIAILRARVEWVGRSSLEVGVLVVSEDPRSGARARCCDAFVTMVSLDADGRPQPVPPLAIRTAEERRRRREAERRRRIRLLARARDERRARGAS